MIAEKDAEFTNSLQNFTSFIVLCVDRSKAKSVLYFSNSSVNV